jgi:hypothetical protein
MPTGRKKKTGKLVPRRRVRRPEDLLEDHVLPAILDVANDLEAAKKASNVQWIASLFLDTIIKNQKSKRPSTWDFYKRKLPAPLDNDLFYNVSLPFNIIDQAGKKFWSMRKGWHKDGANIIAALQFLWDDERVRMLIRRCQWCNNFFKRKRDHRRGRDFCSPTCKDAHKAARLKAKKAKTR